MRAGLRHNPFKLEAEGPLPDALFAKLGRNPTTGPKPGSARVIELVGPPGAGKSTQLLRWRLASPGPYRHVPDNWTRWYGLPVGAISYWDEAYRVPAPLLQLALRRARRLNATVVVAGHVSIADAVRKARLDLDQHEFPYLTAAAVQAFFARRVQAAALAGCTPAFKLPDADAKRLADEAGASLRAVSDALHIWIAAKIRE